VIGVLHEAARRRLSVPDDLSVVGFDGLEATKWSAPELTTIEQPIDLIAERADDHPNSYYRRTLRVRASTPAPAAVRVAASA
jgi:Periplasmic binding protein-like domain